MVPKSYADCMCVWEKLPQQSNTILILIIRFNFRTKKDFGRKVEVKTIL